MTYRQIVGTAAELARSELNRMACMGVHPAMALCYRESTATAPGELRLIPVEPDGRVLTGEHWTLADCAPMPKGTPSSRIYGWIEERAGILPILMSAKDERALGKRKLASIIKGEQS